MNLADFLATWRGLTLENRIHRVTLLGLIVSNLLTGVALLHAERTVVLVPPRLEGQVSIARDSASQEVKESWALFVAELLGNASPTGVGFLEQALDPLLAPALRRPVLEALRQQVHEIQRERVSMTFETRALAASLDKAASRPAATDPQQQAALERLRQEHAAQLEGLQREQQELRARLMEAQKAPPPAAATSVLATPPAASAPKAQLFAPPGSAATGPKVGTAPPKPLEIRTIGAHPSDNTAGNRTAGKPPAAPDGVPIPAGSILRGVLLSGMDAPTARQARREPYPALVRLKHDALLPNRFRADVRECFLVAAGYGDLASERAYLRTEAITCIRDDGGTIEVPLDAYAVGEDGKVGIRGRLVSKQGQVIGKAMLASFADGFSQMFGRVPVPVLATAAGTMQPFQQAFSGQAVQAGAVKGVGSALDRLANYFMDMAEEMFPVIEVDAGRGIEFVLNRGATLRLGQRAR